MPQTILTRLAGSFPGRIYSQALQNENELVLEVNPAKIREISQEIAVSLEGTLVSLFANDERALNGKYAVYYIWALRKEGCFILLRTLLEPENPCFISITNQIHQADLYEREIRDLYGLIPLGHPDSRSLIFHGNWPEEVFPLRKDFERAFRPPFADKEVDFMRVDGTGVYEIPVGPVHAGIIEPGHFRFSVAGEPVINLEARLYYVHKGLEKLAEGSSIEKCYYLAERISGDESFSNSLAYCQAVERIAGINAPERALYSRVIFAELERLTSHLGDLAGICVDVAYGFAAFQFRLLRGWSYLLAEELAHSRFLRNINLPGGIRKDFIAGKEKRALEALRKIKTELDETVKIIKANPLFIDRVENTGVLKTAIARDMNAVGPAGRASGLPGDARKDLPYAAYGRLSFQPSLHLNGDVNCRMNVKIEECCTSLDLMRQALEMMPSGEVHAPLGQLEPFRSALGYTEAPRGENIHWLMTGENNTVFRYKVRTPSFCNWPALCHAVKGNIVPDFPLINKSFNLSYAGNDL